MSHSPKSVAILGGSFDPVHLGHMSLAEEAYKQVGLEEVWFMPAAQSPLKKHQTFLGAKERIELLEAAVSEDAAFKVNRSEIDRGGISFTVDTLKRLKATHPETEFSWIIGGDQLQLLEKWKDIEELCSLMEFSVRSRPGYEIDRTKIPAIPGLRFSEVKSSMLDIASSDIRRMIAAGESVNHLLPTAVHELIVAHKYYRD
ncbi:MAG: nicotinate-nucleotide adenylyltransferase [Opitutales bacterium]|nr:nicotinate-nucleotide adenylyltransferase [Opitutales bacterium]